MKKLFILCVVLIVLMGGSYYLLRLENIRSEVSLVVTYAMIILVVYLLFIRPRSMAKLWIYVSFLSCLGISYIIILSAQRGYLNNILFWLPF